MTYHEARISELIIQSDAIMVEVEGMKVANRFAEMKDETPVYNESIFEKKAEELRSIAVDLRQLAERLG